MINIVVPGIVAFIFTFIARKDFGEEYGERYTCDRLKGYELI